MTSKSNAHSCALLLLVLHISGIKLVNAQSQQEELDLYQAVFGIEKKAVVAGFINVTEDAKFWILYDACELERKELGKKRLNLLQKYANNYNDISGDEADVIIKDMQTRKKALDKLIDTYYKKNKKNRVRKLRHSFTSLRTTF